MKLVTIIYFSFTFLCNAQNVFTHKEPKQQGQIFLTDSIAIPYEQAGYTLLMPSGPPVAVTIFLNSNDDPLQYNKEPNFEYYALMNNIAVLYISTGNRLEFFFDSEMMRLSEKFIHNAIIEYNLPKNKICLAGMSLSGTRAIKFTNYLLNKKSDQSFIPVAVAICDSPLDFVRFWKVEIEARDLNFHPVAANEGAWVSGYLEKNLGGTPRDSLQNYIDYSPYCTIGSNDKLKLMTNIPVRAYSEPDVEWWMQTRRKDYYEMNVIDLAAFINELNKFGNQEAKLILTHDKGYLPDGRRQPHSWSIVDNQELVYWFIMQCTNKK